ncbi:peroxiredoxin family protein [Serpentinicella alkaliphila]|uniref:Peroxiredoxin n=1 Tax=Serpentinicella alkaliphila TaxID=1734049 RepID=A0A4R2TKP5_9FIRM|nr:TlpA disulfide reductase family protein [Serpentinicella alkaliphila]QUH25109.1 TlpA family protein disulfide reductase [Serpentinicella alkaliphila]TCQ01755.1 peroxiredoxin [Serpentinicella alkaliphila]
MKKLKSFYMITVALVLTASLLFGCTRTNSETNTETLQQIDNSKNIKGEEKQEGLEINLDKAKEFSLLNIDDKEVALGDFKGSPIILNFWVSWNEDSIKQLEKLQNIYPLLEQDVIILAINATSFETMEGQSVKNYIKDKNISYDVLIDKAGDVTKSYYVGNFPTTFFIDGSGDIVKMVTNNIEEDQLLDEIELLLEMN